MDSNLMLLKVENSLLIQLNSFRFLSYEDIKSISDISNSIKSLIF